MQREFLDDDDDDGLSLLDDRQARVGQEAPDFELESHRDNAELIRLSDFRGRTVVLNFWSTWCPPCSREMPLLQETFEEREADGVVVLSVDFKEDDGPVASFIDENGITFPIVMDRSGQVAERYGLRGLPWTFFIDADGIVRNITRGPVLDELLPNGLAAALNETDTPDEQDADRELPEVTDETGDVFVVNTTDREVSIVTNGQGLGTLAPGEERALGTYQGGTAYGRFMAFETGGEEARIFNRWVTWADLVAGDFRIEVVVDGG